MSNPLRIGVVGTGHLGRIHLRCLHLLQDRWTLVGCCDPSAESRERSTLATVMNMGPNHRAAKPVLRSLRSHRASSLR